MSTGNVPNKDGHGHMTAHGMAGVPGVFFNYEISPMLVIHRETRQSFAHFITSYVFDWRTTLSLLIRYTVKLIAFGVVYSEPWRSLGEF